MDMIPGYFPEEQIIETELAANSKISLVTPEYTLIVNIAEPEAVPEDEDEEAAEE